MEQLNNKYNEQHKNIYFMILYQYIRHVSMNGKLQFGVCMCVDEYEYNHKVI